MIKNHEYKQDILTIYNSIRKLNQCLVLHFINTYFTKTKINPWHGKIPCKAKLLSDLASVLGPTDYAETLKTLWKAVSI